jgi:nitroreductase
MDFYGLIKKTRTYRRFYEDKKISAAQLRTLVQYAALTPSGANKMPLKYIASTDAETNGIIFANVSFAAYLPEWGGPKTGERPSAYLIMLRDTLIAKSTAIDEGIQAEAIMLGAVSMGLGGCIMGTVRRAELAAALHIASQYEIALVLALGVPKEEVVIEKMEKGGDIKYWHDGNGVHHVPKRSPDELLIKEYEGNA